MRLWLFVAAPLLASFAPSVPDGPAVIAIDAAADRHPISPLIYGASFADTATIADLGLAANRSGGNSASLYDWRSEARNAGRDWYFESMPVTPGEPAQYGTRFIAQTRAGGAAPIVTVPMIGWVAKLAPGGGKQASFAISKYGAQEARDSDGLPDAGNGNTPAGRPIVGNDPHDAAQPDAPANQQAWIRSLVAKWGEAAQGGVPFYALDNEPSRWHDIHRDVHPVGLHAREIAQATIAYARMVKVADPSAKVLAPEEWGWNGYRYSGFDQQAGEAHGYRDLPDRRDQTGGMDLLPWLLTQWKRAGHPIDILSVHYYPQGGEFHEGQDDVSPAMQARRNRSTRALWDRAYTDESWIADRVALIPRLRDWSAKCYYPGTPLAITEYSWGADGHMNGATAQADILGIFGREGVYMAARWMAPARGTPIYLAMKLFRNPHGTQAGFGETSVAAQAPDPDTVAAFAAVRAKDGVLTVVAINKRANHPAPVRISLAHFARAGSITGARVADGRLIQLPPTRYRDAAIAATLPPQSVTLFEVRPDAS
ncbi:glycoside hydrolase family 44 protein [Sphingomonas glacialis]|uniref:Cellulase n=1 Tax=Sphingomonas glacialis TaxID=658225 RepID=A0A502FIY1_9SPHN|nr:glycoside hydrolase family 44 protein [Sphingomonas glacialis]TPG49467.1 cellulase [Sphingomonas glacialis]